MKLITADRIQATVWIGTGIAVLALLLVLGPVLTPFAAASILAYLLAPGADWLQRRRLPRWLAALLMILLLALVVLGLVLILVPVLQRESTALQTQFPLMIARLNDSVAPRLRDWFGVSVQFDAQSLRDLVASQVGAQQDLAALVLQKLRAGGSALLGVVGMLVLVPVVLFYVLLDWHTFMSRVDNLIPRRWHSALNGILNEIDGLLAQFLRGQLTVMLVLAAYYSVALTLARFETALPIGLLTGLLIFIPYVGFTLGLLLALFAAALQFGDTYGFAAVAVIYGAGQVLEGFFLTPRLVGERIGLHPLGVIFALLAFGQVFGFLGVLLALPATAAMLVALRRVKQAYFASDFYRKE
ncbi:MAG TPA: AI-2E family transporter [Burkholderiaceae bacterium]|nr:AI-2E family transporter [Burkholderiaceae bacterium]